MGRFFPSGAPSRGWPFPGLLGATMEYLQWAFQAIVAKYFMGGAGHLGFPLAWRRRLSILQN